MTLLAAALTYAGYGWRVIPILPHEKRPSMARWTEFATTDRALIVAWWTAKPDHGLGIVTGPGSGIFVLDVDVSDGKRGDETLADLEATYGALPNTPTVLTGSGGAHYYFKMPPGVTIANDAGRRLGPGLDIRGEGGQVLAPPTRHPNGRLYEWDAMSNPETVAVAEAPAWLVRLLTEAPPDVAGARRDVLPRVAGADLPGDIFAASHTWAELLTADGATYLGTRMHPPSGTSYELWARPGVDHASATLYYNGSDVLKVHTTAWPGLEAGGTYTRFGYWTHTRYGGDFSAAAAAIRVEDRARKAEAWRMDVEHDEKKTTETGFLSSKGLFEKRDLEGKNPSVADDGCSEDDDQPWDEPLPFTQQVELPPFPDGVLPSWLAGFCRAVAIETQTPVDLAALLGLSVLATCAGGRVRVQVTDGWHEPCNLFTVTAMAPGTRKSAVFLAMSKPLFEAQATNAEAMRLELVEAKSAKKAAQRAMAQAEADWAKAEDAGKEAATERLKAAAFFAEAITLPTLPRLLADDATPEALGSLMAEQGGRMSVMSAEGDVFDLMAGRYSGTPNLGIYLKGHAGDPYVLDRKGREPEFIKAPALTMGLAVQPDVLGMIADRPGVRGRGLLARFLYALPASTVGERDVIVPEVPGPTRNRYETNVKALCASLSEWTDPMVLTLAPEAREALRAFQVALEPRLGVNGDLHGVVEWASKLAGAVVRVAGLLHLADNVTESYRVPIGAGTLSAAIAIAEYLVPHAQATFGMMGAENGAFADANFVLKHIRDHRWERFNQRDLHRAVQGRFPMASYLARAMALLDEYGYVRVYRVTTGRGRPAVVVVVNPAVFREKTGEA